VEISIVEMFVWMWSTATAVTVEVRNGRGLMIEKTRGTAVFHQEAISVAKLNIKISWGTSNSMLTARQECYNPGTNHAMMTTVPPVQR